MTPFEILGFAYVILAVACFTAALIILAVIGGIVMWNDWKRGNEMAEVIRETDHILRGQQ